MRKPQKRIYHPLELNGPKPGTPEYHKNFDDWYDQTYGYGLANSKVASFLFGFIMLVLIIIAIAIPVVGIRNHLNKPTATSIESR